MAYTYDGDGHRISASGTINYLTAGLGGASMLTDSNGNVTGLHSYGAYGATATTGVSDTATVDTSFKYAAAVSQRRMWTTFRSVSGGLIAQSLSMR